MKIEAVGRVIETESGKYPPGKPFDIDDKEAAWLIKKGFAKKSDGEQKGMDARRRKSMESDAVQKKLGTAEEVAKLSDADLEALLKKTEGNK